MVGAGEEFGEEGSDRQARGIELQALADRCDRFVGAGEGHENRTALGVNGRDGGAGTDEAIEHRQGFAEPPPPLHLPGQHRHRLAIAWIGREGPLPAGGRGVHAAGRGVKLAEAAERCDVAGEGRDDGSLVAAVDPLRHEGRDRLLRPLRALRGAGQRGEEEATGPFELPGRHPAGGIIEGDECCPLGPRRGGSGLVGLAGDAVV